MITGEAVDRRPLFCETLEDAKKHILENHRQPAAVFIHVHFDDGTLSRNMRVSPGFDWFHAIGAFECAKLEASSEIMGEHICGK